MINQLCFFISYTITRMFLGPYLIWLIYMDMFAMWQFRTSLERFCSALALCQASLVLVLNLYWYYLILQGLKKLLQKSGLLPGNTDEKTELEKFEDITALKKKAR